MASLIDPSVPTAVRAYTADVRANFKAAKDEIEALQAAVAKGDLVTSVATRTGDVLLDTKDIAGFDAEVGTVLASPPDIGSAAPAAGTFTALAASSLTQPTVSGPLAITTMNSSSGSAGGAINITAASSATGSGGAISLTTGGGLFTGNINLKTATTTGGSFAASGSVNITTGNSNGTTGSGSISLTTGNSTAASTPAGAIFLTAGNTTSGAGGDIGLQLGSGSSRGGRVQIAGTGPTNNLTVAPGAAAANAIAFTQSGTGGYSFTGPATMASGGTLTGTFAGTHTLSGAVTISAAVAITNTGVTTLGPAAGNKTTITGGAATTNPVVIAQTGTGGIQFNSNVGFNSTPPVARPAVSGSRGGNAALAALITSLASIGLVTDSTTA